MNGADLLSLVLIAFMGLEIVSLRRRVGRLEREYGYTFQAHRMRGR